MKNESMPEGAVERPAIRVQQPLGDFYAFSLRADYLNRISYSYPAEAVERMEQEGSEARGGYSILGSQRAEKRSRLDEIASFIRTTDATFPNAIILGVNSVTYGSSLNASLRILKMVSEYGSSSSTVLK